MVFQDLKGQKFGLLTVEYRVDDYIRPNGSKIAKWHCKCECGGAKDMTSDGLKRKNSIPSCGCLTHKNRVEKNRESFLGQKFNRLTIIEELFDVHPTKTRCQCECGNIIITNRTDVINGHTQSCGCLQKERASEHNLKDWSGVISDYGVKFLKQEQMNDKGQWLWRCRCGVCGEEFIALPAKINSGHTTSCGCTIKSSAERYIHSILNELGVNFIEQYSFKDCRCTYPLKFDFVIFYNDMPLYAIEYDGKQHFQPIEWFGGENGFVKTKQRDVVKNEYCLTHNIPLLRLPYILTNEEIKQAIYKHHLSVTTAGCV